MLACMCHGPAFVRTCPLNTAVPTGNSWDLSSAVMDRALMHADGVYKFPAQRVRGHMCRTHIASNTAFRGFGGPQVRRCGGGHALHRLVC